MAVHGSVCTSLRRGPWCQSCPRPLPPARGRGGARRRARCPSCHTNKEAPAIIHPGTSSRPCTAGPRRSPASREGHERGEPRRKQRARPGHARCQPNAPALERKQSGRARTPRRRRSPRTRPAPAPLPKHLRLHPSTAPGAALTARRRLLPRPLNNEPGPGRAHAPRFARPARLRLPAPSARSARAPGPASPEPPLRARARAPREAAVASAVAEPGLVSAGLCPPAPSQGYALNLRLP